jgi:hypothetical protein
MEPGATPPVSPGPKIWHRHVDSIERLAPILGKEAVIAGTVDLPEDLFNGVGSLELDWLAGKVVALGRKYGVPTPGQEAVYAILKPYRTGLIR